MSLVTEKRIMNLRRGMETIRACVKDPNHPALSHELKPRASMIAAMRVIVARFGDLPPIEITPMKKEYPKFEFDPSIIFTPMTLEEANLNVLKTLARLSSEAGHDPARIEKEYLQHLSEFKSVEEEA